MVLKTKRRSKKAIKNGKLLNLGKIITHTVKQCKGAYCCVHRPSDHHMREWDRYYRVDKGFLLERICPKHRIGHPDPDSAAYFESLGFQWIGVHGCCGCCKVIKTKPLSVKGKTI